MKLSLRFATAVASILILGATADWSMVDAQTAPPAQPAAQPATQPAARSVVAVVDIAQIFQEHARFQKGLTDIENEAKGIQAQLREQAQAIQARREELNTFNPGTPEYKNIEEEVARRMSELQVEQRIKLNEIREREARLFYNTYVEVVNEIKYFAQRNGIQLVLRFDSKEIDPNNRLSVQMGLERDVIYQSNLNITDYILQRFKSAEPVNTADSRGAPGYSTIPPRQGTTLPPANPAGGTAPAPMGPPRTPTGGGTLPR